MALYPTRRKIVSLPRLIAIFRQRPDGALGTCCRRLAGQNKCSLAEIMHTSNVYNMCGGLGGGV